MQRDHADRDRAHRQRAHRRRARLRRRSASRPARRAKSEVERRASCCGRCPNRPCSGPDSQCGKPMSLRGTSGVGPRRSQTGRPRTGADDQHASADAPGERVKPSTRRRGCRDARRAARGSGAATGLSAWPAPALPAGPEASTTDPSAGVESCRISTSNSAVRAIALARGWVGILLRRVAVVAVALVTYYPTTAKPVHAVRHLTCPRVSVGTLTQARWRVGRRSVERGARTSPTSAALAVAGLTVLAAVLRFTGSAIRASGSTRATRRCSSTSPRGRCSD